MMKNLIFTLPSIVIFSLLSAGAWAPPNPVPEVDGGSAAIALGLTAGIIALIMEHRGRK